MCDSSSHTAFGTTTPQQSSPFGSSFPQSQPAFSNNLYGSTSLFCASSTPAFGATTTPAFGFISTPAFGSTTTPAFGQLTSTYGSSPFGARPAATPAFASSGFGQNNSFGSQRVGSRVAPYTATAEQERDGSNTQGKLESISAMAVYKEKCHEELRWEDHQAGDKACGGFGSATKQQSSPFGSRFPQSQSAFSSNLYGSSSLFGASRTPAFGATKTPAFGSTSTPAFGATVPAFGSTPTLTFGNTCSAFDTSDVGASAFGNTNTNAINTPAFGSSTTPTFGSSTTPSFNFGYSPAFGQSTSAFGSSPFGSTSSPFGAQTSQFGAQPAATPAFASSGFGQNNSFGGQRVGSRVVPYTATAEQSQDGSNTLGKLESISAMAVYKEKCHEELRWEDYQVGDKGGRNPAGQSSFGAITNPMHSSPFATSSTFGQTTPNPFSSAAVLATTKNIFAAKSSPFGATTTPSPFGQSTQSSVNPFAPVQPSQQTSLFSTTTPGFGSTWPAPLFTSSMPAFRNTTSLFGTGSGQGQGSTSAFGTDIGNTESSSLFGPTTSLGQSTSAFGQTGSSFGQTGSTFGQTSLFSTPNTGFPTMFSTTPPQGFGQATLTLSTPFQSAQPTESTSGFVDFSQWKPGPPLTNKFDGMSLLEKQLPAPAPALRGIFRFVASALTGLSLHRLPPPLWRILANPSETLPAMPQMSTGHAGTSSSVQHGISGFPDVDKPAPVRKSSLRTPRHISQRRIRLHARKYNRKSDGQKVAFFSDEDDVPSSTPKADAIFVPRENPRALVTRLLEQWPCRNNTLTTRPARENVKLLLLFAFVCILCATMLMQWLRF